MANNKNIYLYKCPISYKVMYWIANTEKSLKRNVGYPYLISFNKKNNMNKISKKFKFIKLNNRTIDCLNQKNCINILRRLVKNKVFNLDLGAYQINYMYHKIKKINSYFSLKESYMQACNILNKLIKKYGYNWKTIAKYHSFNYLYQKKYLILLSKNIDKKTERVNNE